MLRFFSRFIPLYRINIDNLRLQASTPVSYKTYQFGEPTGVFCTVPPVSKGTWVRIRGDMVIQSNGHSTVLGDSALQKCLADNWIVPFWQYGKAEVKKLPPVTIASLEAKRREQNPSDPQDPDEPITWRHWPESIDPPAQPPATPAPETEVSMEAVLHSLRDNTRKNIRNMPGSMLPSGVSSRMEYMEALVHYEGGPVLGYIQQGATPAEIHDFYTELDLILKEKRDRLSPWMTEDEQLDNQASVFVEDYNREMGIMKHPIPTAKPSVPQSTETNPPQPPKRVSTGKPYVKPTKIPKKGGAK